MPKHAYLIMAHGNWSLLQTLLHVLDDPRHDIFIHIDCRASIPERLEPEIRRVIHHSHVQFTKRINVYWADFSQVEATLELLKSARSQESYSYYHLLSGTDFPLKSNTERYDFFEASGKEFLGIMPQEVYYCIRRVKYYHLLLGNGLYRNSMLLKALDRLSEYLQKLFGINRLLKNSWEIVDGWTWFSITDAFCQYVLEQEPAIRKLFSHSIASDEMFMQTLAWNSHFRERLYDNTDLSNGSMRYIDWKRGRPYTWGQEDGDVDTLLRSNCMFARKFDERYPDIVQKLIDHINGELHP